MAFIDITDPQSPLACANLLQPYARKVAPLPLTDAAGFEILSHTNAPVIIKRLLDIIERAENPAVHHELLTAMAERREQPEEIATRLEALGYPQNFAYTESNAETEIILSAPTRQIGFLVETNLNGWENCWENADKLLFDPQSTRVGLLGYSPHKEDPDRLPVNLDMSTAASCRSLLLQHMDFAPHHFKFPPQVKELEIKYSHNFPGNFDMAALPNLRKLSFLKTDLNNFDFATLPPTLEEIEITLLPEKIPPEKLDFSSCPNLKKLTIVHMDFEGRQPAFLPPSLEEIILESPVNMISPAYFAQFKNLKQLIIAQTALPDSQLPALPKLRCLNLAWTNGIDATAINFAALYPRLEELSLHSHKLSGTPILPPTLQTLDIAGVKIAKGQKLNLGNLPNLKTIEAPNASGCLAIPIRKYNCLNLYQNAPELTITFCTPSARGIYDMFKRKKTR